MYGCTYAKVCMNVFESEWISTLMCVCECKSLSMSLSVCIRVCACECVRAYGCVDIDGCTDGCMFK